MSTENHDAPTASIPRDKLLGLVRQTSPMKAPNPHLIARGTRHPFDQVDDGVSPLAVLAVIGVFIALFIAVVQLG